PVVSPVPNAPATPDAATPSPVISVPFPSVNPTAQVAAIEVKAAVSDGPVCKTVVTAVVTAISPGKVTVRLGGTLHGTKQLTYVQPGAQTIDLTTVSAATS